MEQSLPQLPRKAIVVHSPGSGRSTQLVQALATFHEVGIEVVENIPIATLDSVTNKGMEWQAAGIDLVIAAGGDGLVGGVTAQVITSDLPLGILPLGTANDVARSIHMPLDARQAALAIATGVPIDVDIGIAHPAEQPPHRVSSFPSSDPGSSYTIAAGRQMYFSHALTVGLNVQFARLATDTDVRQRFGSMTYPFAVVEALRNYHPVDIEVHLSGLHIRTDAETDRVLDPQKNAIIKCRAAQVTVVNAPIFWGALEVSVPGVSLSDQLLDIVVVEDASIELLLFRISRFFSRQEQCPPTDPQGWHAQFTELYGAELTDIAGIHHIQAQRVAIKAVHDPLDATLDGEVRGQTPIHAEVSQERLRLIIPTNSPLA